MQCISDESHGVSSKIWAYPFVSPDLSDLCAAAVLRPPVQPVAISGLGSSTTFPEGGRCSPGISCHT